MEPVNIKRILTYSALYPNHKESLDEIIKSPRFQLLLDEFNDIDKMSAIGL